MNDPVVVVSDLVRSFGKNAPVVDGVQLEVSGGEVLGLIGPNGGGKSTLLMLIAGLIRPTSGSVLVGGMSADQLALGATGTVGLITAEAGLYPLLTGWENLFYFGGLFGLSRPEIETRARPLPDELGIDAHLDRPSRAYSSGQRPKVSLARALLLEPRLLLLDEPTANLDPVSTRTIHEAVRRQADAGVAVVLATHDLHAAEGICDRVAVMQRFIRSLQTLDGERRVPEPSRLYRLYEANVEET